MDYACSFFTEDDWEPPDERVHGGRLYYNAYLMSTQPRQSSSSSTSSFMQAQEAEDQLASLVSSPGRLLIKGATIGGRSMQRVHAATKRGDSNVSGVSGDDDNGPLDHRFSSSGQSSNTMATASSWGAEESAYYCGGAMKGSLMSLAAAMENDDGCSSPLPM